MMGSPHCAQSNVPASDHSVYWVSDQTVPPEPTNVPSDRRTSRSRTRSAVVVERGMSLDLQNQTRPPGPPDRLADGLRFVKTAAWLGGSQIVTTVKHTLTRETLSVQHSLTPASSRVRGRRVSTPRV